MISRTRRKQKSKTADFGVNDDGNSSNWVDPDWDSLDDATEALREEFGKYTTED